MNLTRKKRVSLVCFAIADQIITWPADLFSWFGNPYLALFGFGLMFLLLLANLVLASPFWLVASLTATFRAATSLAHWALVPITPTRLVGAFL